MTELKEAFSLFDKHYDGYIAAKNVGQVLRYLGEKTTNAEIMLIVGEFDRDQNGSIDFSEFMKLMERRARLQERVDDFKQFFRIYDRDNNGQISTKEIKYVCQKNAVLN